MRNSDYNSIDEIETKPQPEVDNFFVEAVNSTYDHFLRTVKLASTKRELLLMQSLQGRAMNGWWEPRDFYDRFSMNYSYPNTTLEEVFDALGFDVNQIQTERQNDGINDSSEYIDRLFEAIKFSKSGVTNNKKNVMSLVNEDNEVLAGIKYFEGVRIKNPVDVLVGAYLGGCMDCAEWRARTDERYGIKMHRGVCMPVNIENNMEKLKQEGLTLKDLANKNICNLSLEQLIDKGIVSDKNESYKEGYINGFIELQPGFGISDDAAFISAGLLFSLETAYGLMLMDAVDTWDKSTPFIVKNGQDEKIGLRIKTRYEAMFGKGSFPCDDEDVMKVIYLASKNRNNVRHFPSCSQRRFVQYDSGTRLYPIQSHVAFIDAVKTGSSYPPSFKIAFEQIETGTFYRTYMDRYRKTL